MWIIKIIEIYKMDMSYFLFTGEKNFIMCYYISGNKKYYEKI